MDCFNILAQSVQAAETSSQTEESIVPLQVIWGSITSLSVLEALTFIAFGVVCLLYGWRVFKILVIISFALLGLAVGLFINDSLGELNSPIICGVAGLIFLGILSVPLMKYGVSVLGAVAGGIVTAGIWYACSLPENYIWAGALVGVVAGGMISFIVFRVSIMLFSSLGGSSLIVVGLLHCCTHIPLPHRK